MRSWLIRFGAIAFLGFSSLLILLWSLSLTHRIGLFSLGSDTSMRITGGVIEVERVYRFNIAPAVPVDQWHKFAVSRGWVNSPPQAAGFPMIWFSSGHVVGIGAMPDSGVAATVAPANYWVLRIPLWLPIIPSSLLGCWFLNKWLRQRQGMRRGFAVMAFADVRGVPTD